ncbi:hypothetical protein K3495_g9069 [Podosphaera aphanis]|nr:hypothetical protein K3495_g9069 [Podosphaera aphanis]
MTDHARLSAVQIETAAGLLAGTISTLLVHPLDVIKTRLQVQRSAASAPVGTLAIFRGLVQRDQPIQRLYRGLTPNLVGNASSWAVFFCCKSMVEDQLLRFRVQREAAVFSNKLSPVGRARDRLTPIDYFFASGISGAIITLSTNPIWVLKTRMLSSDKGHTGAYQSMWHGAKQILRKEGLWGFYKGIGVSLLGNSHGAVQFGVYEPLKKVWRQTAGRGQLESTTSSSEKMGITATLVISGLAKIIAGTFTYPLQVLRTRMQAHHSEHVFGKGIVQVAQKVWLDQGWRGFYKGLGVNAARVLPTTWVTFLVYENSKYYMSTIL